MASVDNFWKSEAHDNYRDYAYSPQKDKLIVRTFSFAHDPVVGYSEEEMENAAKVVKPEPEKKPIEELDADRFSEYQSEFGPMRYQRKRGPPQQNGEEEAAGKAEGGKAKGKNTKENKGATAGKQKGSTITKKPEKKRPVVPPLARLKAATATAKPRKQ